MPEKKVKKVKSVNIIEPKVDESKVKKEPKKTTKTNSLGEKYTEEGI